MMVKSGESVEIKSEYTIDDGVVVAQKHTIKKPRVAVTIADDNNMWMVEKFTNSLRKFHSEEELPLIVISGDDLKERLKKDPHFFYRATPILAKELLQEYEAVFKFDCDQIVTGDLDFVLKSKGWDVGTVINFNRLDSQIYGVVTVWDIGPKDYFNCGLVAMRSEPFVDDWLRLCMSPHFDKYQMREQDLLNIVCHYFNYKVKCFDMYDKIHDYSAWHGLISKSEWQNIEVIADPEAKTGKRLILKSTNDGYVPQMVEVKVLHWAGGKDEQKLHYKARFNEDVISYLDELVSQKSETLSNTDE